MTGSYGAIDKMVATVAPLNLPYPVLISPPLGPGAPWTAKSDTQDRPLRVDLELDPETGSILKRVNFNQHQWIDQAVGYGVAAHEGQLFGLFNQLLGVFMATGLVLLSISAVVMWWRTTPGKCLGCAALACEANTCPRWAHDPDCRLRSLPAVNGALNYRGLAGGAFHAAKDSRRAALARSARGSEFKLKKVRGFVAYVQHG